MEASNSLKKRAEEAIKEGKTSFQFGNIVYNIGDTLPVDQKVNSFFQITVGDKKYILFRLRKN